MGQLWAKSPSTLDSVGRRDFSLSRCASGRVTAATSNSAAIAMATDAAGSERETIRTREKATKTNADLTVRLIPPKYIFPTCYSLPS